ncbi:MAG: hypothetical protein GDA42_00210 [Ekhidna sp.]|nr:hypothetical protein [Ekhidna sp.]
MRSREDCYGGCHKEAMRSREDCYDVIVVILNLQGFSNIIHQQGLLFFIKTRLRPSAKSAGEWRACRKVSRPQTKG